MTEKPDIVERLIERGLYGDGLEDDAADEITKLRGLVKEVMRSYWPPPPSWYAAAEEAVGRVSRS